MAIPGLVQHVASATNLPTNTGFGTTFPTNPGNPFFINLPNASLPGNCLVLTITCPFSSGRTISITDNKSNTWSLLKTVNNGSFMSSAYCVLDTITGTEAIEVQFDTQLQSCKFDLTEFYNIDTASVLDTSVSASGVTGSSIASGSMTTTSSGDLIYHYGFDTSNATSTGNATTLTGMTASSGFTFLTSDVMVGVFVQTHVQASAGAINPAVTLAGTSSDDWNTFAIALKSASQGTPPPLLGIRIVHVHHVYYNRPITMQFPCSGNLLYVTSAFGSDLVDVTGISSSPSNTWVELSQTPEGTFRPPQCWYAVEAKVSNTFELTMTGPTTTAPVSFVIYDIIGAANAPFDNATYDFTDTSTPEGSFTLGTITPSTHNGLIIATIAANEGYISGSGQILDSVTYNNEQSADTIDNADGYAHIYNSGTSSISFTWVLGQNSSPTFNTTVVAFKAGFYTDVIFGDTNQ